MKKPSAIDLFSGCGGLTLGLRQAGFEVLTAVEIDDLAAKTYRKNHPRVKLWHQDICTLSAAKVMAHHDLKKGELDLLAGCPPCQGFSTLTTLNGSKRTRDPRNQLVLQFLRFVRAMRPKAIMFENVPNIENDARMKSIVRSLGQLGYQCNFSVLNAAKFGVPQRRRRFILLAHTDSRIPFATPEESGPTVRSAFSTLTKVHHDDPLNKPNENRSEKIKALIKKIPKDGGSRNDLGKRQQLDCHKKTNGFHDVYGRMSWDKVSPTITGGCCNPSKGRFLHPTKNRTITLREAALLQSFPPNYYFSLERGKSAAAQMIGNALPPEFIKRHARQIFSTLREGSREKD